MRRTLLLLFIFFFASTFIRTQINTESRSLQLKVFLIDSEALEENKVKLNSGDKLLLPAFEQLYSEAEAALNQKPFSVTFKNKLPPSGDKHDYMSLGPYWWPDPDKPDGLPYIRKDGVVNPEVLEYTDKKSLVELCRSVHTLALTYYLSDEERFAEHAAKLIKVWFIDDQTKMNPNFNFGQAIPGYSQGRSVGLIESRHFSDIIDALGLIKHSIHWNQSDEKAMEEWFREYFNWLINSELGREESEAPNNHGTWYDVQAASIALYLNEIDIAKNIFETAKTKRITDHIESDGSQPRELARTRSLSYSAFNLKALCSLALLAEQTEIDLWNYQSHDGISIKKAIDFILPYVLKQKEWQYPQISGFEYGQFYPLLYTASGKIKNNDYQKVLDKYKLKFITSTVNLTYTSPSLTGVHE